MSCYLVSRMEAALFLIKKYLKPFITCIDVICNRVCCIKLITKFGLLYIFNVYMHKSNNHNKVIFFLVYRHVYIRMKLNNVFLQGILIMICLAIHL